MKAIVQHEADNTPFGVIPEDRQAVPARKAFRWQILFLVPAILTLWLSIIGTAALAIATLMRGAVFLRLWQFGEWRIPLFAIVAPSVLAVATGVLFWTVLHWKTRGVSMAITMCIFVLGLVVSADVLNNHFWLSVYGGVISRGTVPEYIGPAVDDGTREPWVKPNGF